MFELVESKTPTPYRLGGMPKGISLKSWPRCVGCSTWQTPMFSLDATAEFPLGDRAGLVAFACAAGCGWPETKASISHVRAFTKAEWRLGKRAPHGVTLLPERYATLQPIELPKIPSRVCGFSPTFLTTDKCKLKERPLIAYRYKPKQLAVITMCSAFHFGSWIDIPPLTSKAFERIKARRAERA